MESATPPSSPRPARRAIPDWVWYAAGGFSAGVLLALLTVGLPLYLRETSGPGPAAGVTTETPALTGPTATVLGAQATQVELHAIVEAGCRYLSNDTIDPQAAVDLLAAHVQQVTDHADRVQAYECLAFAESLLDRFQMAASYYEELYLLEPSVEYLFQTAVMYDNGGDLQRALEKYLLVVETDDPEAGEYEDWALERAIQLQDTLQYPHPTASPSPSPAP
jgi:tetratricopeptide (TPR) repeat protein